MARQLPPELQYLETHLETWAGIGAHLQKWYIILGILASATSLGVAAFASFLPTIAISSISFVSALSVGLISHFNVGRKVSDAWTAWRHLNAALMKYRMIPTFTEENLIEAYSEAERILGNASYSPPTTSPTSTPNQPHSTNTDGKA